MLWQACGCALYWEMSAMVVQPAVLDGSSIEGEKLCAVLVVSSTPSTEVLEVGCLAESGNADFGTDRFRILFFLWIVLHK